VPGGVVDAHALGAVEYQQLGLRIVIGAVAGEVQQQMIVRASLQPGMAAPRERVGCDWHGHAAV
jgi:NhaP-type Na+/H+ and K+/H+ antiporter